MSMNPEQGGSPGEELDQTKELRLDDLSVADRDVRTGLTQERSEVPVAEGHVDRGPAPDLAQAGGPKPEYQPGGGER